MEIPRKRAIKRVMIVILIGSLIYLQNGLRHQAFTGTPDRVNVCGRSYGYPGDIMGRQSALTPNLEVIGTTQIWLKKLDVWSLPAHDVSGYTMCGMSVFVEFSENEFRKYTLLGGP